MKLLLLGSDTGVGQAMANEIAERGLSYVAMTNQELVWSESGLNALLLDLKPDYVINAHTLESENDIRLSLVAGRQNIPLVQLSSNLMYQLLDDQIYAEADEANADVALSKLEQQLAENSPRHLILRAGWLLGHSDDVLQALLLQLKHNEEVLLPESPLISPTPVEDVARVLLAMIFQCDCADDLWGTYHYAAVEALSAKAFAQVLATEVSQYEALKMESLQAGTSDLSQLAGGQMSCKKILHTFGIKPRPWRTALSLYLTKQYGDA